MKQMLYYGHFLVNANRGEDNLFTVHVLFNTAAE